MSSRSKTPGELYEQGREVLKELAPLVTRNGMGAKFAELVDLVDLLKPEEKPEPPTKLLAALQDLQRAVMASVGVNIFDTRTGAVANAAQDYMIAAVEDAHEGLVEKGLKTDALVLDALLEVLRDRRVTF